MTLDEALSSLELSYVLLGGALTSLQTISMLNMMSMHNAGSFNRARASIVEAQVLMAEAGQVLGVSVPPLTTPYERSEQRYVRMNGEAFIDFLEARPHIKEATHARRQLKLMLAEHGRVIYDEALAVHPMRRALKPMIFILLIALVLWILSHQNILE